MNFGQDVGKLKPLYIFAENAVMVQSLWKTGWKFFKELKTELPYGPAVPFLGIYLKESKSEF